MKLFSSTKKLISKTKIGENISSLQMTEVVFVQCNLADFQYQQNYKVLYTISLNQSYAYLLIAEPSILVFLKTYNTKFDEVIVTFTDQNYRSFEIKGNVNLILLINKEK